MKRNRTRSLQMCLKKPIVGIRTMISTGSRWDMATRPMSISSCDWLSKEVISLTIIVHILHVIEYLWKAGSAFHLQFGLQLEI